MLLSFGHGYSARALEPVLNGWRVVGTNRSGTGAVQWPGTDMRPFLDAADHLLISIAPGPVGDPVLALLGDEIANRAKQFQWVGYLSTTGVYGDHDGGWGERRLAARTVNRARQVAGDRRGSMVGSNGTWVPS